MQKFISILLTAAFFGCLLAACTPPRDETAMQNPVVSYDTREELEEATGLVVTLPAIMPDGFDVPPEYHAISGKIAEVVWRSGEAVMTYRLAALSEELSEDISGDYNEYNGAAELIIADRTFRIKYDIEGEVSVATSAHGGFLYAFTFSPPVTLGQFQAMAETLV